MSGLESIIAPMIGPSSIVCFDDTVMRITTPFTILEVANPLVKASGYNYKGGDFLTALKKFPLTAFDVVEGSIICKVKRSSLTLVPVSYRRPTFEGITSFFPLPGAFYPGLTQCRFSGNKSHYSGVYVDDLTMLATDGQKVVKHTLDSCMSTFWISDASAKLLQAYAFTEWGQDKEFIAFRNSDCTLYLRRLRDEVYPKQKILGMLADAYTTDSFPEGTAQGIKNASAMGLEDGNCKVILTCSNGGLEITGDKRTGTYVEGIECEGGGFKFTGLYKHLQSIDDGDAFMVKDNRMFIMKGDTTIMILGMKEE